MRRVVIGAAMGLLLLLLAAPVAAGGWAVVTLDALPRDVRAGQPFTIGFMVRQHGQTPNSDVAPVVMARLPGETVETLRVDARQQGQVGHFVADLTFPRAGDWEWQIMPEPYGETRLGTLTVLPAIAVASAPQAETVQAPAFGAVQLLGMLLLIAAAVVFVLARRNATRPQPIAESQ